MKFLEKHFPTPNDLSNYANSVFVPKKSVIVDKDYLVNGEWTKERPQFNKGLEKVVTTFTTKNKTYRITQDYVGIGFITVKVEEEMK